MKKILLWTMLILTACSSDSILEKRLLMMYERDQSIRHQIIELTKAVTTKGQKDLIDSLIQTIDLQKQIDQENINIIDSLLQKGVPKRLSKEAYKAIWIIIDHSELASQEKYLPHIKQMADEGKINFYDYATLFDRIEMNNNRPQRYGTQLIQFGTLDSPQLYLWPIENYHTLDSLRSQIGLQSIDEYLNETSKTTGVKVNYNPQITIEELNQMRNKYVKDTK